MKRVDVTTYKKGKIVVMHWRDQKEVTLLSTVHSSDMQGVEKRGNVILKPKIVVD
jgi:hypothetical protein